MNQNAGAAEKKPFSWSVLLASVLGTLAIAGLVGAAFFWASQPAQSLDPNVREQAVGWWIVLAAALLSVAVGIARPHAPRAGFQLHRGARASEQSRACRQVNRYGGPGQQPGQPSTQGRRCRERQSPP